MCNLKRFSESICFEQTLKNQVLVQNFEYLPFFALAVIGLPTVSLATLDSRVGCALDFLFHLKKPKQTKTTIH